MLNQLFILLNLNVAVPHQQINLKILILQKLHQ